MRAAILIATLFAAGAAQAKVPLSDVKPINDGLTAVAIADHIRVNCDNISARLVVAWRYIGQLEDQAKEMGYSEDEIEDFVTDKSEKKRVAGLAADYIRAHNAQPKDAKTLCALGRAEIAANSPLGQLLREN